MRDTLQLKSWYRQGLFSPGAMLVYAGRYLACKSALGGPVVIIDFENPIGGPVEIGSVSDGHQSTGFGLDPDKKRLYVISESNTGSQGWVSWFDASFEQHGPWHLVDDLGLPAGSSPAGIAYDRASGRVIVGASSGLFACDPETLEVEQSLLGSYSGGGFVDAWENQPTVDGELWLPHASTIWRIDTVTMTPIASWNVTSLYGLGLDAAVHDPLTEALWTSDGGVWKLWFDRAGHGTVTLGGIVSELCGRAGLEPADLDVSELDQEVLGYMVPRPVAVREALEKLQQAYLFDVVESDWTLAFRKRERDPVLTIGDESLAAHEPGSQRPPKLLETRTQEAELPRRVTVRYLARENDYQAAAQQAQLIQDLYETRNELVLELPVVMTDDEAKRAAWAILASAWVERDGFELYLPPSFLTLDPGDVVDALKITEALTATIRLRLTEIDLSGGWLLKLKGVTDDPIVWQTNHLTGAPTPASEQTGIPFEVPSAGLLPEPAGALGRGRADRRLLARRCARLVARQHEVAGCRHLPLERRRQLHRLRRHHHRRGLGQGHDRPAGATSAGASGTRTTSSTCWCRARAWSSRAGPSSRSWTAPTCSWSARRSSSSPTPSSSGPRRGGSRSCCAAGAAPSGR